MMVIIITPWSILICKYLWGIKLWSVISSSILLLLLLHIVIRRVLKPQDAVLLFSFSKKNPWYKKMRHHPLPQHLFLHFTCCKCVLLTHTCHKEGKRMAQELYLHILENQHGLLWWWAVIWADKLKNIILPLARNYGMTRRSLLLLAPTQERW